MTKLEEIAKIVDPRPWVQPQQKASALNDARAIVECLMEPDEAMYKGYENAQSMELLDMALSDPRGVIKSDWQAMLRAVLDEQA